MFKDMLTNDTKVLELKDKRFEIIKKTIEQKKKEIEIFSKDTGIKRISSINYDFFIYHWYKLNNNWYFYKQAFDSPYIHFGLDELLGEVISEYFDLDTVHYEIAHLKNIFNEDLYGVLSKNFCNKNYTYKALNEYGITSKEGIFLLDRLSYDKNNDNLVEDIKKMIIRDFYTLQNDHNKNNIQLVVKDGNCSLAPLYDYENSFNHCNNNKLNYNSFININVDDKDMLCYIRNDLLFQLLLYKVIDADMNIFLNKVEQRHRIRIPSDYKTQFLNHDKKMKKIIKEYRLIK